MPGGHAHARTHTHTPLHTFPFEFWDHRLLLLVLTLSILVVVLTALLYSSQRTSMSNMSLWLLHRVIGWTHSRLICHMKWVLENAAQEDLSKSPCFPKHGVVWSTLVVPEISESVREDFFFKDVRGVPVSQCRGLSELSMPRFLCCLLSLTDTAPTLNTHNHWGQPGTVLPVGIAICKGHTQEPCDQVTKKVKPHVLNTSDSFMPCS